jgi:3-oxoacyl-[acyl-carrier protein] reductase
MENDGVILITGTSRGIGRFLAEHYAEKGCRVVGCSRQEGEFQHRNYRHFSLDIADEPVVTAMFAEIGKSYGRLDALINNAGIASMNHALLTPLATAKKIFDTNCLGTFLFCREAAKLMRRNDSGRIVNFTTVAAALDLEGEAAYAASKSAVESLTRILARELAAFNITVNAVGPAPVKTDLVRSVPEEKLDKLIRRQAIKRYGEFADISNVVDFYLRPESDFVTGQVLYLGGV